VSEQHKGGAGGKGGFGPKKPRATFGDVMLGIPAGRPGEREDKGRERGRDAPHRQQRRVDSPPKAEPRANGTAQTPASAEAGSSGPAPAPVPAQEVGGRKDHPGDRGERRHRGHGERQNRDRSRESRPPQEKSAPMGPLVVVKRASGAIETRGPLAPAEPTAKPPEPVVPTQEVGPEITIAVAPPPPTPPVREHAAPSLTPEVSEIETFAEMFEEASKKEGKHSRRMVKVGEKVTGTIFQLGAEVAFVTLEGVKSEAMIDLNQLQDEEGILRYGVGDAVEAYVMETGAKGILLSRSLPRGQASMAMLVDARNSGLPVEGLVLSVNKGGVEVAIGDVRAFCPASQVDTHFVGKLDDLVGEKLKFRVSEVRGKNVVLSRRAILEEEQRALAAETRKNLAEGKVVRGKVTSTREFGAFVDLGGIEGLIPISELSHSRVAHPNEVVKVGDELEVEILKIEAADPSAKEKSKHRERITLSLRFRQEDPWKAAVVEFKEGERVEGKIVRLQPFGAFVELRPGVDGLIHVSALSNRRVAHPRDVVKVGEQVSATIEKIDPVERRISLRRITDEEPAVPEASEAKPEEPVKEKAPPQEKAPPPQVGQVVKGTIDRIEPYGVFVAFPGGKGLIPASETGTERGTDLKRHFKLGDALSAAIIDIDASRKIRLSITGAEKAEERATLDDWKKSQSKAGGGTKGFGTFGDLLKAKKPL